MKWYFKAFIQKGLAIFPSRIHDLFYLEIQKRFGKLSNVDFTHKRQRYNYLITNGILARANVVDKKILELGPGRTLTSGIFLWLLGAKSVVVTDIRNKLTHDVIVSEVFCLLNFILSNPQVKEMILCQRLLELEAIKNDGILMQKKIPIQFSFLDDLSDSDLSDFDLQFSLDVLEHIPRRDLALIFSRFQAECKRGCIFINFVDHTDHFSHTDPSIGKINFLRFSSVMWELFTSPTNYTNRLRHEDYAALFDGLLEKMGNWIIRDDIFSNYPKLFECLQSDYGDYDLSIIASVYMYRKER